MTSRESTIELNEVKDVPNEFEFDGDLFTHLQTDHYDLYIDEKSDIVGFAFCFSPSDRRILGGSFGTLPVNSSSGASDLRLSSSRGALGEIQGFVEVYLNEKRDRAAMIIVDPNMWGEWGFPYTFTPVAI